jgi:Protein of unknown function (DUF4232)
MDPNRKSNRLLDEWDAVARSARRPASAPRRRGLVGFGSTLGLVGAALVAVALVLGVGWLGGRITTNVGAEPSPSGPVAIASAPPSPTPAPSIPTPPQSPTPTIAPSPTPAPTIGPCDPANLAARITAWEGAAGSRIADVSLTNAGDAKCLLAATARPQLIDGRGAVLAQGRISGASVGPPIEVAPGDVLTTLVQVSNVCGAPPVAPVTVAFDLGGGLRLIAQPLSPTDTTVPPCNGPGSPAEIEMHPWSR